MITRNASSVLNQLASSFPIVAITGPRQSGKTTLVKQLFAHKPYASLENMDQRDLAHSDPRRFLAQYPDGAILDEVQRCPDLFSYLQGVVDDKRQPGQFVLTGSQQFNLLSGITQSLAGRVGLLNLLPFTYDELQSTQLAPANISELIFKGLYPPVYDRNHDPKLWYDNYINTYIERDVRQLIKVKDLSAFQRFLKSCAARTGQLLSVASLANDCGINVETAKGWLSVLEASYIIHLLRPHYKNFNKRLIKSPKLYFIDTGVAARLLGIQQASQLDAHPLRGELFETWVVAELLKHDFNQGLSSTLYFWRDYTGNEVDVLIDRGLTLLPVEIKSGQTVTRDMLKSLEKWQTLLGQADEQLPENTKKGCLVYGGDQAQTRLGVNVIPWQAVTSIIEIPT
jgi:uncharacterized protein